MKKKSQPTSMSDNDNLRKNFSIIERLNLNELDRQLINCKSSPISYHQFYEIARSIVEINFDENQVNNNQNCQDQEEFEKTLTKLLQLCQTIIDFLLADTKRLQIEHTELTDRNNLVQENGKLRKLLQLQQKAILYGRMNMLSRNYCDMNKTTSNIVENEDNSLDNFEQLPSDSKSNNQNCNLKINLNKLQCIYCSKCFTNTTALSKHLHLTHLSSSLDDPSLSLSSSISSNLTCIQRIFQHCSFQPSNTLNEQKIFEEKINNLKNDLSKAFSLLEEEKLARKNFENNVRSNFEQQFNSIRLQVEREFQAFRKIEKKTKNKKEIIDHNQTGDNKNFIETIEGKSKDKIELFYDVDNNSSNNCNKIDTIPKRLNDTGIDVESNFERHLINKQEYSEDPFSFSDPNGFNNNDEQISIKQNLRNDLILQLKSKRLLRQKEKEKDEYKIDHLNSDKNNKLAGCLDIKKPNSIDYNDTKTEINESVEARIKSYLNKLSQNSINDEINDEIFQDTMNHINQDKTLLIQQSRYDYDFVKIENSIRKLIDSKVSNKILDINNAGDNKVDHVVQAVPIGNESNNEQSQLNNGIESIKSAQHTNTALLNDKNLNQLENVNKLLKSILKIKTNNDEKSNLPKRNISFNNEVIEFEISPLTSDNENDEREQGLDNSLKIILNNEIEEPSKGNNQFFDATSIHFNNESHFDGERIFLDNSADLSTSSSSSDNDENDTHGTLDTFIKERINIPVPAKRNNKETLSMHSVSSLNSLLSQQDSNNSGDNQSRPTKVQELAELIETKLKKPISNQIKYLNSNQRLPPILPSLVNLNDTTDSNQF